MKDMLFGRDLTKKIRMSTIGIIKVQLIRFMEELKEQGFTNTYCFTLVDDKNFYSGRVQDGIYSFFRAGKPISGIIEKPTTDDVPSINISKEYVVSWEPCGNMKYYLIKIQGVH